jgi:hypothetical protein
VNSYILYKFRPRAAGDEAGWLEGYCTRAENVSVGIVLCGRVIPTIPEAPVDAQVVPLRLPDLHLKHAEHEFALFPSLTPTWLRPLH